MKSNFISMTSGVSTNFGHSPTLHSLTFHIQIHNPCITPPKLRFSDARELFISSTGNPTTCQEQYSEVAVQSLEKNESCGQTFQSILQQGSAPATREGSFRQGPIVGSSHFALAAQLTEASAGFGFVTVPPVPVVTSSTSLCEFHLL